MKTGTLLSVTIASVGLLALAVPAHAQRRGNGGGGNLGHTMNHGGIQPGISRGGTQPGFNRGGTVNRGRDDRFNRGRFGHSRVNFFFGGFGYPYYYGYPYGYGYGYGYGYPPYYGYGYGYPAVGYSYDPQGVYNGRVVPRGGERNRQERDPKDQSSVEVQVQQQLAQAGYYRGEIDGVVGDGTRRAIRSYERANGLRVDGRIDNELLSTMGLG